MTIVEMIAVWLQNKGARSIMGKHWIF